MTTAEFTTAATVTAIGTTTVTSIRRPRTARMIDGTRTTVTTTESTRVSTRTRATIATRARIGGRNYFVIMLSAPGDSTRGHFIASWPVMRTVRDQYLPPDHAAFVAAEPPTGRIIVIAPTRAACETIELALGLYIDTVLEKQHGEYIRQLAGAGKGFGIVAGTGTGKTLSIRPISETILKAELKVGVVNREREATPETPTWNVIIVTTG